MENRLLLYGNFIIECGEIDGIVLDSWINMSETSSALEVDEDGAHVGYWSAAAVWFDAWDKKTVDRVSYFPPPPPNVCMSVIVDAMKLRPNSLVQLGTYV